LDLLNQVILNTGIPDIHKGYLVFNDVILYIYESSLKLDNIYLTSQYTTIFEAKYLFFPVYMNFKTVSIYNSDVMHEGMVLFSNFQLNVDLENVNFDLWKSQGGFYLIQN